MYRKFLKLAAAYDAKPLMKAFLTGPIPSFYDQYSECVRMVPVRADSPYPDMLVNSFNNQSPCYIPTPARSMLHFMRTDARLHMHVQPPTSEDLFACFRVLNQAQEVYKQCQMLRNDAAPAAEPTSGAQASKEASPVLEARPGELNIETIAPINTILAAHPMLLDDTDTFRQALVLMLTCKDDGMEGLVLNRRMHPTQTHPLHTYLTKQVSTSRPTLGSRRSTGPSPTIVGYGYAPIAVRLPSQQNSFSRPLTSTSRRVVIYMLFVMLCNACDGCGGASLKFCVFCRAAGSGLSEASFWASFSPRGLLQCHSMEVKDIRTSPRRLFRADYLHILRADTFARAQCGVESQQCGPELESKTKATLCH